ncbi:single-stranded DNA-binding protein [Microvirga tunisiensis]|uniref:single-stranded DNA-binding protein n=1 Tax=Microvirga tunisiensis TaxID=2108360 RepID=UPI001FCEE53A|nr:single-stranded DNA-binding protein [Microvirga tunisiensis]
MRNVAKFEIRGQVVRGAQVGKALKVTIAANYRVKEGDEWKDDPHYNTVTIFNERMQKYIADYVGTGDLVQAEGRIRQGGYAKNGEQVYTVDLICDDFSLLSRASSPRSFYPRNGGSDVQPNSRSPAPRAPHSRTRNATVAGRVARGPVRSRLIHSGPSTRGSGASGFRLTKESA